LIEKVWDGYKKDFQRDLKLDWGQVLQLVKKLLPSTEGYNPGIVEEMQGMAKGTGLTFEDILVLNVRSELTYLVTSGGITESPGGCTSLVATPEATMNGHVFIGQNWDWKPETREVAILLKEKRKGQPNCVRLCEAGTLGKVAFTSAGIGFVGNALITDRMYNRVPTEAICDKMFTAESLAEAIGMLVSPQRGSSMNRLLADVNGQAIDIEAAPDHYNVLLPEGGVIVHTNHFAVFNPNVKDVGPAKYPNSLTRLYRARQLVNAQRGKITVEVIQNIFRDHLGKPNSICWHLDERLPKGQQVQTNGSVIMDLNEKTLHVAKGPPCENEYIALDFKDIL
jgi:isopenicillin-N N-acyltransferase-like protein